MKNSLSIFLIFCSGIASGYFYLRNIDFTVDFSLLIVYLLIFFVGILIGSDKECWSKLRVLDIKIILVPLSVIIGTFIGVGIGSLFIDISFRESLAVGAGFGYYSLSSIIITNISGNALGVVALLSNIIREITTLIIAPILCKYFGKLSPIASGGATSMDTTLPVIMKWSGKEFVIIAILNGIILTALVPFLVTFILQFP